MAFYNNDYSQACKQWIANNKDFYDHFRDTAKTLELDGLLHIYDFALKNLPEEPQVLPNRKYGKLVKSYYNIIHSTFGVRTLISYPLSISSWKEDNENYIYAATSWLIHDDFYETLIDHIIRCFTRNAYERKEMDLKKLKDALLKDSINLGIRTIEDWMEYERDRNEIKNKTVVPKELKMDEQMDGDNAESPECSKESTSLEMIANVNVIQNKEDDGKDEKQYSNAEYQKTEQFRNMLLCDDSIKMKVIEKIAKFIIANPDGNQIAVVMLALGKMEWIFNNMKFEPFYNAFKSAMEVFIHNKKIVLASRPTASNYYSKYYYFLTLENNDLKEMEDRIAFDTMISIANALKKVSHK